MDTSSQVEARDDNPWQRHRDEIKRLYIDEELELSTVMRLMAQKIPNPSMSSWKKQIARLHLDVKHHKRATIMAAVAHYQHCLDTGETFHFAPEGCRPVTLHELERYLKRKRLVISNGALHSKDRPAADSIATPASNERRPAEVPCVSLGGADAEEDEQASAKSSNLSGQNCNHEIGGQIPTELAQQTMETETSATAAINYHRWYQRAQRDSHPGPKLRKLFVRPLDLLAPSPYYNHENFLRAVKLCLSSSYDAGMWTFEPNGIIIRSLSEVEVREIDTNFDQVLQIAAENNFEVRKTRGLIFLGLRGFYTYLSYNFVRAMNKFFSFITRLLAHGKTDFLKFVIDQCSRTLQATSGTYAGLHLIFCSLSALEPQALWQVISHAFDVQEQYFVSFNGLDRSPPLDFQRKIAFTQLSDPRKNLSVHVIRVKETGDNQEALEAMFVYFFARKYTSNGTRISYYDVFYNTLSRLYSVDRTLTRISCDGILLPNLFDILTIGLCHAQGFEQNIRVAERLADPQLSSINRDYFSSISALEPIYDSNSHVALALREHVEEVTHQMVNLEFKDNYDDFTDSTSLNKNDQCIIETVRDANLKPNNAKYTATRQQSKTERQETSTNRDGAYAWRDEVAPAERDQLTLPVLEWDEAEMLP